MNQEINQDVSLQGQKTAKEKREDKVSEQAKAERKSLSSLLLEETESLAKAATERRKKKEEEEFQLHSGRKLSIREIKEYVISQRQPYVPKFPNDVPFFKEMYRLLDWVDLDPNKYEKPAIVGWYINQIIYSRFNKDVLPALKVLAIPGGIRLHKFSQFLNEDGQDKVEQYRDEAIALMKKCTGWYEFMVKYGRKYGLSVQKQLFEAFDDETK